MIDEQLNEAKAKALRLLGVRDRTAKEIEARLKQSGVTDEVAAGVCSWLTELGYLDDERFARQWVEGRQSRKAMGRRRMRHELLQKGVDREIVQETLQQVDDDTEFRLALEVSQRRMQRLSGLDADVKKRRLYQFLARRGFSADAIQKAVESTTGDAL